MILKKRETVFSLIIAIVVISILLILSGSINSGYHLADDHTILTLTDEYSNLNFWQLTKQYMVKDLSVRFRPMYTFLVAFKMKLIGLNMNYWMIVDYLECIATYLLLYLFARMLEANFWVGNLFASLSLFGNQFTPWFRALNQENEGTFFLATSLFLIGYGYYRKGLHKRIWYRALIIFSVCLCSLMKEAYVMTVPCFIFIILYLEHKHFDEMVAGQRSQEAVYKSLKMRVQEIRDNLDYVLALLIMFITELYIIIVKIGTTTIGYAGVDEGLTFSQIIDGMLNVIFGDGGVLGPGPKGYYVLGVWGLICFLMSNRDVPFLKYAKKFFWLLFFVIYGILSQLFLHIKSGMAQRYLLPAVVIYFIFIIVHFFNEIDEKQLVYGIYFLSCVVFLVVGIGRSWESAKGWAQGGKNAEAFLSIAASAIDERTPQRVLIAGGADEWKDSIRAWLLHYTKETPLIEIENRGDVVEYEIMILYPDLWENDYLSTISLSKDDYEVLNEQSSYVVAVRK